MPETRGLKPALWKSQSFHKALYPLYSGVLPVASPASNGVVTPS